MLTEIGMVLFIFIVVFVLWYSGEILINALWNSRLARENAERMIESLPKIRECLLKTREISRDAEEINRKLTETLNSLNNLR